MTEINRDSNSTTRKNASSVVHKLIIGGAAATGGILVAGHIQKQAAQRATEEAARQAKPFYSNITNGIKNIASPKSATGIIGLAGAAAATILYRDKLGSALSNLSGLSCGLKDLPSKISNGIENIFPKKIETPVDGFVKEGKHALKVGKKSVFAMLGLGKEGLDTMSEVAKKLKPIIDLVK